MYLTIVTQPVSEPITLTEAKLHLKVETATTTDDELIKTLITAARNWCEAYERKAYVMRTYQKKLDAFSNVMSLDYPPLVSVQSVKYTDTSGTLQTLTADTDYDVDEYSEPGVVRLAYLQSWPSTRYYYDAVEVNYTAGYSTTFKTAFSTDVVTVGNAVFANGDIVVVESDAGDLPAPLAVNTNYYVGDVSGSTLKLHTDSALTAEVNLSDDGTGTHFIALARTGLVPRQVKAALKLLLTHLYENRAQTTDMNLSEIPMGVKNLLYERCW